MNNNISLFHTQRSNVSGLRIQKHHKTAFMAFEACCTALTLVENYDIRHHLNVMMLFIFFAPGRVYSATLDIIIPHSHIETTQENVSYLLKVV